jgi:hypothetical protein
MIRETAADREREARVVAAVCKAWGCTFTPHVRHDTFDVTLHFPARSIVAEIKCRRCTADRYSAYQIAEKKVIAARQRPGALLIVRFEDALRWIRFASPYTSRMGGRTDRGLDNDIELMACFARRFIHAIEEHPFA